MLLEPSDAELFHRLYQPLLGLAAGWLGGVAGVSDFDSFEKADMQAKYQVREALHDHPEFIDRYVDENPDGCREPELAIIRGWKHTVRGKFFVERDLKRYTVFLTDEEPFVAYGVLGLTTEIVDMLPVPLPAMIEAVLLPWKGQIVCDGLVAPYQVVLGAGIRGSLRKTYREAKQRRGIVASLEPPGPPNPPGVARPRKGRATIQRFLEGCPRTVLEFQERYGRPRLDMCGKAAEEDGPWGIDGTPILGADYLMVYGNILRDRVLYVYAIGGQITHISVVDPSHR